jgi:hypothetical protein
MKRSKFTDMTVRSLTKLMRLVFLVTKTLVQRAILKKLSTVQGGGQRGSCLLLKSLVKHR